MISIPAGYRHILSCGSYGLVLFWNLQLMRWLLRVGNLKEPLVVALFVPNGNWIYKYIYIYFGIRKIGWNNFNFHIYEKMLTSCLDFIYRALILRGIQIKIKIFIFFMIGNIIHTFFDLNPNKHHLFLKILSEPLFEMLFNRCIRIVLITWYMIY